MSKPGDNQPVQLDARNQGMATARPMFTPETFTGVECEWADWAEQFEMAADANNWDELLRFKFMGLLLSGRACEVYSGQSATAKANYVLLKDTMVRCLDPWNRASFSARRRLHHETH